MKYIRCRRCTQVKNEKCFYKGTWNWNFCRSCNKTKSQIYKRRKTLGLINKKRTHPKEEDIIAASIKQVHDLLKKNNIAINNVIV